MKEKDKTKKDVKVVSVGLDAICREKLERLAMIKYRIPHNLSHTLRLLIDDSYQLLVKEGLAEKIKSYETPMLVKMIKEAEKEGLVIKKYRGGRIKVPITDKMMEEILRDGSNGENDENSKEGTI